jgi:hypothetical protein
MMYPYQASGDGEITVDEGAEVTIVEPDGKLLSSINSYSRSANIRFRRRWLDEGSHTLWRRSRSCLLCRDDAIFTC